MAPRVTRRDRRARLVAWSYPSSWRARYGEELLTLLEDTYADGPMNSSAWMSLVRAGVAQRCRAAGVVVGLTRGASPHDRARAGTLSVAWAWLIFVLSGSSFAKFSEHWDLVTRPTARAVPSSAMSVMQVAAWVRAAVWLAALAVSWRALGHVRRQWGGAQLVRLVRPALVTGAVIASSSAVLIVVAHHLSAPQRNGASAWYSLGFLFWATLCTVGLLVAAAVVVGRVALRLEFTSRELRIVARRGVMAMSALCVMVASMLVWWVSLASDASRFFDTRAWGASGTAQSLPMILVALMMGIGLAVATSGTRRALHEVRRLDRS